MTAAFLEPSGDAMLLLLLMMMIDGTSYTTTGALG
jgi:hypothetical protein